MSILALIVSSLIVGVIATLLMPGRDHGDSSSPFCWALQGYSWAATPNAQLDSTRPVTLLGGSCRYSGR